MALKRSLYLELAPTGLKKYLEAVTDRGESGCAVRMFPDLNLSPLAEHSRFLLPTLWQDFRPLSLQREAIGNFLFEGAMDINALVDRLLGYQWESPEIPSLEDLRMDHFRYRRKMEVEPYLGRRD